MSKIDLMSSVAVGGTYDSGYSACVESVIKVVFYEKIRSGNDYSAELVKSENRKPELIMTFHNEHYPVALFDSQ